MNKKIKLGNRVRDTITGLEGTAVAIIEYLNGCVQYEVQPQGTQDCGKIKDVSWIDEAQLEITYEKTVVSEPNGGGIRNHPPRR